MVQKPEIVAFAQYRLGGVQNFYYNILGHLPKDEFEILWILDDSMDKSNVELPKLFGITKEIVFKSFAVEDKTVLDKFGRLMKLVSDRPGLVVTNFYLELAALHLHRRKNKTIYFVCHDELYLTQAVEYEFLIDVFIAHNPYFFKVLQEKFPQRAGDIFYLPYGVSLPSFNRSSADKAVRVVFAARLVKEKGIFDLPDIVKRADAAYPNIEWTIIGHGPFSEELKALFAGKQNVAFSYPETNDEVRQLMSKHDIFILPSYLDGLPVAMLEAMSVGCVPVIYKFNEGISEVLSTQEGFILPSGDKAGFADVIINLCNDRALLEKMSGASRKKIRQEYDVVKCAAKYADLFSRYKEFKKPERHKFIAYGGWLEQPFIPGFIRRAIRNFKKQKVQ